MNNALIVFVNILVMLAYAAPAYILIKTKMFSASAISGFNILLLYVAQPCLAYYSLTKIAFDGRILLNMLYTFLTATGVMLGVILIGRFITAKKQKSDASMRIANIAFSFGNCTFIGIPLLEALLPEYKEAAIYSCVFYMSMSIIGWTVASFIITNNKKHISIKKIFLNPATVGLIISLPFFIFNFRLPAAFHDAVSLMGRMSTPLCMLILGMRLATLQLKSVFMDRMKYLSSAVRLLLVPMIYIGICLILPIGPSLKTSIVVCGSAPVAAIVLNYSELLGEGQEFAAGTIVLSNIAAVITMPAVILLMTAIL